MMMTTVRLQTTATTAALYVEARAYSRGALSGAVLSDRIIS